MNAQISRPYCALLFVIGISFFTIIVAKLFWIQIINHSFYLTCAERQYFFTLTEYPPRAPIFDRTGTSYLALNKESLAAFIIPTEIQDRPALEAFLKHHFPAAYERLSSSAKATADMQTRQKKFLYVARRLTPEQKALIDDAQLADIHFLQEPSRFYPVPSAGAIVGITDIDNNGLFGIEKKCDAHLKGKPHTIRIEKDARSGHYIRAEMLDAGISGKPVQLTIDATLQFLAHEAVAQTVQKFGAKQGAAIIMDPITGEILAMVNVPSFDPNHLAEIDLAHTKATAITDTFELGSVLKVFSALAALAEGVVTPDELIDCKNTKTTYIEGRKINTVLPHGIIPFNDVIAFSNNIGIAIVARRVGDKLYTHYKNLGFGSPTGIELMGEAAGFVNPPHNWSKQSIISLSYGYEITATLMQLACAFALIARDGVPVHPHILYPVTKPQPSVPIYDAETISVIKEILRRTSQYGTAKKAQVHGCTVMSKTGTANMLINGEYVDTKNRYTCAGIVQKGAYQRVIVTFVQEAARGDLFAATVTAPLFEEIAERMLIHEKMI
jgi:cell division protein FtsI (penicillin-binding protein 3)